MSEEKKQNRATEEHFAWFKDEVEMWLDRLGLHGWEVQIKFNTDKETQYNAAMYPNPLRDRYAEIELSAEWGALEVSEKEVRRSGFHEVAELFLHRLRVFSSAGYARPDEVQEEIHSIIHRLEKTLWEKNWGLRAEEIV